MERYYLAIRPISPDPARAEPYLKPLAGATGLDSATIKQKLVGTALQVLKVDNDGSSLEKIADTLKRDGVPSTVIRHSDIRRHPRPRRIKSVELGKDSIKLLDPGGADVSISKRKKCLLVLFTEDIEGIRKKRLARQAFNHGAPFSMQDILHFIFCNRPVMDIYLSGSDVPLRINGTGFNYSSLGEQNKGSVAGNFPVLIKEIERCSAGMLMDTGFWENTLPFIHWPEDRDKEKLLKEFAVYSRFAFLACKGGLFTTKPQKGIFTGLPLLEQAKRLFWAGPLLPVTVGTEKANNEETTGKEAKTLPQPPHQASVYRPKQISTWGQGIHLFLVNYKRYIRTLGPPILFYPLTAVSLASFALYYTLERYILLPAGFISMGLILFIHSFVLLRRKRTIENCPTSKVRSMPMGEVEVKGYARQKYYLKSPHSLTDCVYYSYKIYEETYRSGEHKNVLREWGDSGRVPFYLEDDTGRVLINPEGAIVRTGRSRRLRGSMLARFAGIDAYSNNATVVEKAIAAGQFIYIKGYASRLIMSGEERKKTVIERLRELKRDGHRMRRYDSDMDGTISEEEWEAARRDIEDETLLETLNSTGNKDDIAIGEHPSGGLFYITDRHEEGILRTMTWKIPLLLIFGGAAVTGGAILLLRFFQLQSTFQ